MHAHRHITTEGASGHRYMPSAGLGGEMTAYGTFQRIRYSLTVIWLNGEEINQKGCV